MINTIKRKIIIIGGPTASGKTNIALKIAKEFNGELINADSRQVYKYLDIGTNKGEINRQRRSASGGELPASSFQYPDNNTRSIWELATGNWLLEDVPIHLISFLNPDQRFSVFEYKQLAEKVIEDIINRGKLPILVGGTGLYIDAIIKSYQLPVASSQKDFKYRRYLETLSIEELQNQLSALDSKLFTSLNNSDKNNPRRLIRLIEKVKNNQLTEDSSHRTTEETGDWMLETGNTIFLYPEYSWEELKEKIENRVDLMFKEGIIDETKKVLSMGYPKDSVALQGTGYKEVIKYLDNEISLEECVNLVKTSHKQYARRQRTWFEGKGRGYKLIKVENKDGEIENYLEDFLTKGL
jgi:tRNA dimethylallyltransferase